MKYNRLGNKTEKCASIMAATPPQQKRDAINRGSRERVGWGEEERREKKVRGTQEATFEKAGGKAQHKADNNRLNSNNGQWD